MEFLTDYIVAVALGVCLCIGYVLKQWERIPNNIIVPVLAVIGVVINAWANGWTITPDILLGGMISGIAASGLYEYFNRFIKKDEETEVNNG